MDVKQVCDTTVDEALGYGLLALGCPAMGAEVLEEAEFEPFFTELEGLLGGKRWLCSAPMTGATVNGCGTGAQRADSAGANVYQDEGLILHLTPDEEGAGAVPHLRGGLCQVLKGPDQEKRTDVSPRGYPSLFF